MFYDVVEFVYSHKMSPALCRELPKLLAPPVNQMIHMEHIRILSQYRYIIRISELKQRNVVIFRCISTTLGGKVYILLLET